MARPGVLKFYKGSGAAAFSILPPRYNEAGYLDKQGAILLEAAPSVGRQQWDWDQKITFAISISDIAGMLDSDPTRRRIFHKHDQTPKVLEVTPADPDGPHAGTFMMNLSMGKGDTRRQIRVPFNNGEWTVLVRLLLHACPLLIGWTEGAVNDTVQRTNQRRNA